ncbi:MAG: hypothetical protein JOZ59_01065 [Candidatus Eremiobacteraeota bacterium]|nr:hypothetical protein [Candidatus Eremiobacteraeota bacterium]
MPASDSAPNVPLTIAVIDAGGGPQHYDTVSLFRTVAGRLAGAELFRLRMMFGRAKADSFLSVFNFAVKDIVTAFHEQRVDLNVSPAPDPHDGHALSVALVTQASRADGSLDAATMLGRLLSPSTNARVSADIERNFGADGDRNFLTVLQQSLQDMKRANHL